MNFSKKFLRVVSLVLMVLILIPGMPSFAATFKDVKSSHWAYGYIENMVKEGYIKGDPDGNFRPDLPSGSLSYLEVLTFVSRIIDLSVSEKQTMKSMYQTIVNKNGVPEWAQEAVMICLFKGVISESELEFAVSKGMIKTGTTGRVGRLSTSIYLGKAMGLEEVANSKPFVSLSFKDLLSIDAKYHKLIYTLIEAGVLDPKGTGDGNFEPLGFVSRAQMAKMLSTAHDYLKKNPQEPPTPIVTTEVVNGIITKITNLGTNTFLSVKTKANTEIAYLVDTKTTIKLDNKGTTVSSLYEGQTVEVIITKGTSTAVSVLAKTLEEEITGIIKSVSPVSNKLTVEYTKDKVKKTIELIVDKNTEIILDGEDAVLYDLNVNDEVKLLVENNLVVEIEGVSKSGEIEGYIADLTIEEVSRKKVYYVTIENSKGNETEYELHEDVYIYRNGKKVTFEDLKIGDEAVLELEYGLVVEIDADVVEKDIEGFITKITTKLNSGMEITINDRETGDEETYLLARDVKIKVDGEITNSFKLNVGYFVEAVIGSNEIIEIDADSSGAESMVLGEITGVSAKRNEIDVKIKNTDISKYSYGDLITIKLDANTDVIAGGNYNYNIDDLVRRDNVLVFGLYDGYTFIASEIIIR